VHQLDIKVLNNLNIINLQQRKYLKYHIPLLLLLPSFIYRLIKTMMMMMMMMMMIIHYKHITPSLIWRQLKVGCHSLLRQK